MRCNFLVSVKFSKLKAGIFGERPVDAPFGGEQQQVISAEILDPLGIAREVQIVGIYALVIYPAHDLIRHAAAANVNAVLVFQPVFKHLQLKYADDADDDLLNAGVRLVEYLYRALLRYLHDALFKLLALHRVDTLNTCKNLGSEGRYALELHLHGLVAYRVADRENAGVEHADDVTCVGLVYYRALLRHKLLRLRKTDGLAALNVEIFLVALKFARAYAHEGDPVAVSLVHVCLDLENKGGELVGERIDDLVAGLARQGRHGHVKKALQKRLNAEVVERRAEEHGAELAVAHLINVEFIACAVEQLNIVAQSSAQFFADKAVERFGVVKAAFDSLYTHKAEIESALGTTLQWNRGDDIKSSKVFIQLNNVSIENETDWLQMANFHADWTKRFYDVIVPFIKQ